MTVLFKSKETTIVKLSKGKYKITYPYLGNTKKFWTNFPWHELKIAKKDEHDEGMRHKIFEATSVQTLPQFLAQEKVLTYEQAFRLLQMIGNFIKALERFAICIPSLEMKDIVVVDEKSFFLVEDSNATKIWNDMIEIKDPSVLKKYQKNKFISPEIKKITSFPKQILANASYYNLAALTVFCLFKKYLENNKQEDDVLNPIYQTKLYWTLKRCLCKKPRKRFFLVI